MGVEKTIQVTATKATASATASVRTQGRCLSTGRDAKISSTGATTRSPPRSPNHQMRQVERI